MFKTPVDTECNASGMTDNISAATGQFTTNGMPNDSTSITPHVVVSSARDAIAFYEECFEARTLSTTEMGGIVAHAVLAFAKGNITLGEPMPDFGLVAPDGDGSVVYSLAVYLTNVDEAVAKAVEKGATVREPLATFVTGDRYASIVDPFGIRWSVMTRVEDLSPEDSQRRVDEWAAAQQSG